MNSDRSSTNDWLQNLSRRDLFRTAGVAAGSATLLGLSKFIGNWMGEAEAAMPQRFLASFSLALELEGEPAGILKSVEGGNAFTEVILEPPGPDLVQRKRPGPLRFEDIMIQVPPDFSGVEVGIQDGSVFGCWTFGEGFLHPIG